MKAIIYIPIKDISKKVEDLSEWYTTTDQLSHNKIKSLVQVIVDSDQLQNIIDNHPEASGQRIFERNPDTGRIRSRVSGDYGNETYHSVDKGDEDIDEGESRDEQWYVNQYNRNRHHSEQVKSIDEILKK
tara:strand:+ start:268 stop:657 length:390 start_codon:yes stop_codon:yes gene_type:complete